MTSAPADESNGQFVGGEEAAAFSPPARLETFRRIFDLFPGGGRTLYMSLLATIAPLEVVWIAPKQAYPWHYESIVPQRPDIVSLMLLVQQGDERAFADLYDALAGVVFGTVKRVLRDPAMSEEVTQEVFVDLWRTAQRFDPEQASVSTWVVTLARRRAVDRVRREQSQRDRIERAAGQRPDESEAPDETVVSSMEAERVTRALADLPEEQRIIIHMAFIDGDSHGVIAERLDLPLGTVKSRVRGGLKKLSGKLGGDQ